MCLLLLLVVVLTILPEFILQQWGKKNALTVNRTRDLQIFSLTLSQLSYQGTLQPGGQEMSHFFNT